MGKKKKRQFISKKHSQKFTLVHRSQRDPLQADDEAAQHVLKPLTEAKPESSNNEHQQKQENIKHGILFEDNYDYMQHLRSRGEGMLVYADEALASSSSENRKPNVKNTDTKKTFGNLKLPQEAFASNEEERVGMLNKGVLPRGPQPDWDPDIVAALDDDVDFEDPDNFLEDDFMTFANAVSEKRGVGGDSDEEWETESEQSDVSSTNDNKFFSDDEEFGDEFAREETKSRFTEYSMSSSVIRRTEGLKLLDDRFERIMEEYDEEEIGCVDHEEVQGAIDADNELVTFVVDGFIKSSRKTHKLDDMKDEDEDSSKVNMDFGSEGEDDDDDNDDKLFAQFETKPKEKWDCESILSTYSNIYNHPKLIVEERKKPIKTYELHKRTGIPLGVFNDKKPDQNNEKDDNSNLTKTDCNKMEDDMELMNNIRNKSETAEEKKFRKQNVKNQRKQRRTEKKANKIAFKNEFEKQEKITNHANSQKGLKL